MFADWLNALADDKGKARILSRLDNAALGNFGDCKAIGEGVSEMRIHHGPGYRAYFIRDGLTVYVLLCAGDKASQRRVVGQSESFGAVCTVYWLNEPSSHHNKG